jgi:hypothetical protein
LRSCLAAIRRAAEPPEQVLVIEDVSLRHPALARNEGVRQATGDVIVFVDADVTVHPDVFTRIRRAFTADPQLTALFGSYDDAPGAPGTVSVFRNLLHHHVHQNEAGPASTFWAGLGAIRRSAFVASGGFIEHPIEDIELGMRLSRAGARIVLDPTVQGKHLKRWSLWSMVRTDLLVRGVPWVGLLMEHRGNATTSALNLGWRHRLSALASLALVAALLFRSPYLAASAVMLLVVMNHAFYRLLVRRQGLLEGVIGIPLHVVHLLTAVVAVPVGLIVHTRDQRRRASAAAA